jgi:anti-anti-sigma factor
MLHKSIAARYIARIVRERMPIEKCTVALSIASDFGFVELAELATNNLARMVGFDEDTSMWISMAIRESVINAIKHGNKLDPGKRVDVQYTVSSDGLTVRINDQGDGFNPESIPNPLDPENLLKPTGRGIFYMKTFMDEVEYSPRPGGGTIVRLTKWKDPRRGDMLEISQRDIGEVTILDLSGKITISEGTMKFRDSVRKLIEQGRRKLLLNFADVSYIDSSGIGELVSVYTAINNQKGTLKLLNIPKRIGDLLKITKLITVFETFSEETSAMKSFK